MIMFTQYLVTTVETTSNSSSQETEALIETTTEEIFTSEVHEVPNNESIMVLMAILIPVVFLAFGLVIFLGTVMQEIKRKWFPDIRRRTKPDFKNYGSISQAAILAHLNQHAASTSRASMPSAGVHINTIRDLERRLEGDLPLNLKEKEPNGDPSAIN